MTFTGAWEESGRIPQDTASFTNRFKLVHEGDRVTGEFVREVTAIAFDSLAQTRVESREQISAPIVEGTIRVELGWLRIPTTLRLEGVRRVVDRKPLQKI